MEPMIPSIFTDDDLWMAFEDELFSWMGTPYRHLHALKHRGADCTLWIAACLKTVGILTDVSIPDYYPKDWWLHATDELILDGIMQHMRQNCFRKGVGIVTISACNEEGYYAFYRGDLLTFSTRPDRQVSNHLSVFLGGHGLGRRMIHSIEREGVTDAQLHETWLDHLTNVYRISDRWA